MEKQEQIITTYQQIIQKTELELQNARKRIYYISLLRLILFVGAVANAIDRKSTRLNSSHMSESRMPSSA